MFSAAGSFGLKLCSARSLLPPALIVYNTNRNGKMEKEAGRGGIIDDFTPAKIGERTLKNRLIRAGCYEGLAKNGEVTDRLIEHHTELARGGIGMTTVGYCAVSPDGRAFTDELLMRKQVVPGLRTLTDAVHAAGAAVSIQLVHCGFFADPKVIGKRPLGASQKLCTYRMTVCSEMTEQDMEEKAENFVHAAVLAVEAGFEAVEIHAGHGYLLSQFLSPWTNRRDDRFGGSIENRVRFPAEVVRRVRGRLGEGFPVLVKINQEDGFRGGLKIEDAVTAAKAVERVGASALIPSCGFTSKTPFAMLRGNVPNREMAANRQNLATRLALRLFGGLFVQYFEYEPLFLFEGAKKFLRALKIPVIYVGGVLSAEHITTLLCEGFPFVQIGRATIRDPAFANRLRTGDIGESDCDICNRCVAAMDGGGVYCVSEEKGLWRGKRFREAR